MKTKLLSFTLIELLVALLLSSIVIVSSGAVFLNLQQILLNSRKNAENINNLISNLYNIKNDFDKAYFIKMKGDEIILENISSEQIIYVFKDSLINRRIGNNIIEFNHRYKNLHVIYEATNIKLIKEVTFDLLFSKSKIEVTIIKNYTPDIIINQKLSSLEYSN